MSRISLVYATTFSTASELELSTCRAGIVWVGKPNLADRDGPVYHDFLPIGRMECGAIIENAVNIVLNDVECRVLGALVEKDITTPDYYPLSLNALINACNQKSSREPVMNLDEGAVRSALASLQEKRLAGPTSTADSRVTKYEHRLQEVYNFTRGETAILCVLLLRGPQTPGELRGRTERAHGFDSLAEVQSTLQRLAEREPALVTMLPRHPGTKEARYMHMFSGDLPAYWEASSPSSAEVQAGSEYDERLARVEAEVENLKKETAELRQTFAEFRRQFE